MPSSTIKRSVATLGVVAGLLAAAGPASAQILDGPVLAKAKAKAGGISGEEMTNASAGKAPASPTSEVFTSVSNVAPLHGDATTIWVWHEAVREGSVTNEAVDLMNNWVKAPTNAGTQVGREGVNDDVPLETVSFTFKGEVVGLEPM